MSSSLAETTATPPLATAWSRYPSVYEVNTWVWLSDLSRKYERHIDLSSVPATEWDAIAEGFDAVWLMGVWERSPASIAISNQNKTLVDDFKRALPDFSVEDNVGSPYSVRNYVVDEHLGGPQGLAAARRELSERGMKLILDFVPNHVAPDHPWVAQHPQYFIQGNAEDLQNDPSSFIEIGGTVFASGRDPFFPAWADVLQLNAFNPDLRRAVFDTISAIAGQCDGIRCDMAMLLTNPIFERTWGGRSGKRPATEYWVDIISAIKNRHPNFLFIAEAYWNLEWELQQQGFDFCYDKTLYDRLEHTDAEAVRLHLCAEPAFQNKLLRFIENHDEPRAAAAFHPEKERPVAITAATLPGTKLFHEGQFEGRKVRVPVFLGRRANEPVDDGLRKFYTQLLETVHQPVFREGEWSLCERNGWPGNRSFQNLVAWTWMKGNERYLIAVNLGASPAAARVQVKWADASDGNWHLVDVFSNAIYERSGAEMLSPGLYVELGPWGYHFFRCLRET
ncbi:MAG: alpha-amylase [Acidobacteria bacterium]|nr:alpha-amylase [Acidobacteriota bacterium]